ncbi:hypothetical protein C5167_004617 [Papaver somniferum]|uniref:Uncharacterized protein n=1 Tax=Papaver somniferum TaxID=3469 RepID=A0A4Y7JC47_PAPSO|nr:hypothetical protein C5167_004617 [Papaver somniferum]
MTTSGFSGVSSNMWLIENPCLLCFKRLSVDLGLQWFVLMLRRREPDEIAFVRILSACGCAGSLVVGGELLTFLSSDNHMFKFNRFMLESLVREMKQGEEGFA